MAAFQPKGSRAIRVIVAELAAKRAYGDLLTFEAIAEAIGQQDRAQIRQAVSVARPLLLRDHNRALVAERSKGYRVARPGEFAGIAQDHRRKSDRAIERAWEHIKHAPEKDMTPEELKRHQAVGIVIGNLRQRMTAAEQRLADLEAAVYGPPRKIIQGRAEESS